MPALLVIGAGKWHVPILERASQLGLEVVATHPADTPAPGFAHATHTYRLDARDVPGHRTIAERHRVSGIVTGADLGVTTVAQVAAALGLPAISIDAATACRNKIVMRQRCRQSALAGPRFEIVSTPQEAAAAADAIGYPVVVKPPEGWGSRGVMIAADPERLSAAWQVVRTAAPSGPVLVEEFMAGTEATVEGFVDAAGRFHVLGIGDRTKSDLPYRFDLGLHYPGRFDASTTAALEDYARRLISAFGITMGVTHTELMVSDGQVRLIETAARGCGAFIASKLIPAMTGVPLTDCVIRQTLGQRVRIERGASRIGAVRFVMARPGRVRRVDGLAAAAAIPGVIDVGVDVTVGDEVTAATDTSGRIGHVLAVADSHEGAEAIADRAVQALIVETA